MQNKNFFNKEFRHTLLEIATSFGLVGGFLGVVAGLFTAFLAGLTGMLDIAVFGLLVACPIGPIGGFIAGFLFGLLIDIVVILVMIVTKVYKFFDKMFAKK